MDPKLLTKQQKVYVWDDISSVILDLRILLFECESRIHALALNMLLGHGSQILNETAKSSCLGLTWRVKLASSLWLGR